MIVTVLLALGGAAYYWLIVESHVPGDAIYELDIAQVRRRVEETPGDKPKAIEVEQVATFRFPATAIVAGDGWELRDMPVFSYRLVYPKTSVIIDTALDEQTGGEELAAFDPDAYARVQTAMSRSSLIVITHEHLDHIGGLTAHPDLAAVLPAAKLTREQLEHPERSLPAKFPPGALELYRPLDYADHEVVAPGVALIKAPGHTPGSQMVYVQTADGRQFLFIGDIAWHMRNIEVFRERARLVTWLLLKEDRDAVFGQLAALRRLQQSDPDIHIVPGHDGKIVAELIERGVLKSGFEQPASVSRASSPLREAD